MRLDSRGPGRLMTSALATAFVGLAGFSTAVTPVADFGREVPPGTRAMAEEIDRIARQLQQDPSVYQNDRVVRRLAARISEEPDPQKRTQLEWLLAENQARAGQTGVAVKTFGQVLDTLKEYAPETYRQSRNHFEFRRAVAWMRMGEQQNCLAHHSTDSCLVPIQGKGVHLELEGSSRALSALRGILEREPGHLTARWLLNVAAMTLGRHPEQVAPQYLIPPSAFESDYDIKRFTDVAPALDLAVDSLSGGVVMDDFDNDGWLDLMCSSWGVRDPLRVFLNQGDGTFRDVSEQPGLKGITGGQNLIQADYDNDGLVDVLVLRGAWMEKQGEHPNSLLRNRGDGTFEDVTHAAGLLSFHPTQTAVWLDYDGDGWLDLFVGNESAPQAPENPCELYRNQGDGTFRNVASECGVDRIGFYKAVVSGDFNNDGRPDLYLSQLLGPNRLLRNDGPGAGGRWRFTDVAEQAGVSGPRMSFSSWFWDYNNDGQLDLLVADYDLGALADIVLGYLGQPIRSEGVKLYRNRGDGTFAEVSRESGLELASLAMGVNFGDLDNDGWLDLYLGTGAPDLSAIFPNRMFRNAGGKEFQDVTTSGGFGHLQKGHGIAFGDYDHDGDQDVYAVMGGAFSGDNFFNALFANPGHGNRSLKLKLEGRKSNRSAIGARIRIEVRAEDRDGKRAIHRVVGSGGSFGGNPLRQEIGLGKAAAVERLEIRWPASGTTQVFEDLPAGRIYRVVEGEESFVSSALSSASSAAD